MEDGRGDFVVVVAEDVALVDEVAGDGFYSEGADAVEVGFDGGLAFERILFEQGGGDGGGVDEGVVEDSLAGVVVEDFDVLAGGEAEALVGLGHEVADVDAACGGGGEGLGDALDEQVGDERGVEGAGAESDEVGGGDGVEGLWEGRGVGGVKHELVDAAGAGGDAGFAVDDGIVIHAGGESDVGVGGGVDVSAGGEDLGGHLYGLGEVSGDVGEGGDEEVAEGVAAEVALIETELEEAGEEMLVFGEGDHTVADVAGGEHVEVVAEAAGGTTVISDGDDGGEVVDDACAAGAGGVREGGGARWGGDVALEATEEGGEAGAPADGYDTERLLGGECGHGLGRDWGKVVSERVQSFAFANDTHVSEDGALAFGVEELGEAGIVSHVLKVGVGAGLDAVAGIVMDGLGEVFEAIGGVAGHAGEDGESVEGVVGCGVGRQDGFEMVSCVFVLAVVEQRDGVVVLLLMAGE